MHGGAGLWLDVRTDVDSRSELLSYFVLGTGPCLVLAFAVDGPGQLSVAVSVCCFSGTRAHKCPSSSPSAESQGDRPLSSAALVAVSEVVVQPGPTIPRNYAEAVRWDAVVSMLHVDDQQHKQQQSCIIPRQTRTKALASSRQTLDGGVVDS